MSTAHRRGLERWQVDYAHTLAEAQRDEADTEDGDYYCHRTDGACSGRACWTCQPEIIAPTDGPTVADCPHVGNEGEECPCQEPIEETA